MARWVDEAWKTIPEQMVCKSFISSGILPVADWSASIHSRLKELIFPDEPVVLELDASDEDECLDEGTALLTDVDSGTLFIIMIVLRMEICDLLLDMGHVRQEMLIYFII